MTRVVLTRIVYLLFATKTNMRRERMLPVSLLELIMSGDDSSGCPTTCDAIVCDNNVVYQTIDV